MNRTPGEAQHSTRVRIGEVLAALSLATDLGMSQPMGHVLRACYIAMRIAKHIHMAEPEQCLVYYATLLMHSGCTASASSLGLMLQNDEVEFARGLAFVDPTNPMQMLRYMARNVAPDAPLPVRAQHMLAMMLNGPRLRSEGMQATCEIGARVAARLGMPPGVAHTLLHLNEHWDGTGPHHLRATDIPQPARIVDPASMFDIYVENRGMDGALGFARNERGKWLDPDVGEAFIALCAEPGFCDLLDRGPMRELVLDLEPDGPTRYVPESRLDDVALAFADFVDIKSPATFGHSKSTARLAEAMATQMRMTPPEVADIRRAALLHDLGHVAVGSNILIKQPALSEAENEKLRLHPYYTRRILSSVSVLQSVAEMAGAHHERLDGEGYDRGLRARDLSVGARIIALADAYQDLSASHTDREQPVPAALLPQLQAEVGGHFDADCFQVLSQVLGVVASRDLSRREWPAGLSNREVEVLRLLARGLTNREIAERLTLSAKTVGHHVEHIYNKLGTSNRASAVYFALEHDLVT